MTLGRRKTTLLARRDAPDRVEAFVREYERLETEAPYLQAWETKYLSNVRCRADDIDFGRRPFAPGLTARQPTVEEAERLILHLLLDVDRRTTGSVKDALGIHCGTADAHLDRLVRAGLVKRRKPGSLALTSLGELRVSHDADPETAVRIGGMLAERYEKTAARRARQRQEREAAGGPGWNADYYRGKDPSEFARDKFGTGTEEASFCEAEIGRIASNMPRLSLADRLDLAENRTKAFRRCFRPEPLSSHLKLASKPTDDEADLMIIRLLATNEHGCLRPTEMRHMFGYHQDDVHPHLERLMDDGLVMRVDRGTFALTDPGVDWIMEREWPAARTPEPTAPGV